MLVSTTRCLAIVALFFPFLAFSTEENQAISLEAYDTMVEAIVANEESCVKEYQDDKIYLNPQRLYPTDQGMYLNLNDRDYAILPIVNGDTNGCYIQRVLQNANRKKICPTCNKWTDAAGNCINKECQRSPKNPDRKKFGEEKKKKK